jgi:hypothetical protein
MKGICHTSKLYKPYRPPSQQFQMGRHHQQAQYHLSAQPDAKNKADLSPLLQNSKAELVP